MFSSFSETQSILEMPVEAVDSHNKTLLYLPWASILRQKLSFRMVALALLTKDTTVYLKQLSFPTFNRKTPQWSFFLAPVPAGISTLECAIEVTSIEAGFAGLSPQFVTTFCLQQEQMVHYSLYTAVLPGSLPPATKRFETLMTVDAEELSGVITTIPEMFAPEVVHIGSSNKLFRKKR